MRLIIVATHQVRARSSTHLLRLIESVQSQDTIHPIELYCLLQGVLEVPQIYADLTDNGRLSFIVNSSFISLSAARNQILSSLSVHDDDIIIYQDDDAYLPVGVGRIFVPDYATC